MKITLTKPAPKPIILMADMTAGDFGEIINDATFEGSIVYAVGSPDVAVVSLSDKALWWSPERLSEYSLQIRLLQPGETLTVTE